MPELWLILVSKLIPSLTRALVKLWVGKDDLTHTLAGATIDTLTVLLPDGKDVAEKTVDRLAYETARRVVESLDRYSRGLTDEEMEPVLFGIIDTMEVAQVDVRSLLGVSLDAGTVRTQLRLASQTLCLDFSERQQSVFDRALNQIATELVNRAAELPSFALSSTGEVLRRLGLLLEKLDPLHHYLAGVDAITRDFEMHYRAAIARQLDRMELFGITVSEEASRRYPLSLAYVRLNVIEDGRNESGLSRPAEDVIPGSLRLLIRGAAGSGKTTLLHWLAVRAACGDFSGGMASWNGTVPFFIRLRSFVKLGGSEPLALPSPSQFPDQIASAVKGMMPPAWVERQLTNGRGLVLIDGVDEVPQGFQRQVRDWILELTATYPQSRFVVSSRPDLSIGWLDKGSFSELVIARLGLDEAFLLIDRWHEAVATERLSPDPTFQEKRDLLEAEKANAERLKAELRRNDPLRRLTDTPVLCAMICALSRDRHGILPSSRVGLYRACCEALLHRREAEREIPLPLHLASLELEQKQALLEELAYWMMRNDLSEAPTADVDDYLENRLLRFPHHHPDLSGTEVRRLFVKRTGLLREQAEGVVDFPHKTIMEFLAARAIVEVNDIRSLLQRANQQGWRETVKLAAGLARGPRAHELVLGLIKRGDQLHQEWADRARLHLLAAECVELSVDIDPTLAAEARSRLKALIPPRNGEAARALAVVGSAIVPHLSPRAEYDETTAAACVLTLLAINDDKALDILSEHACDAAPTVRNLLETSLAFATNPEEYAKRVLAVLWTGREELSVPFPGYVPRAFCLLASLPTLRRLSLAWYARVRELGPVAGLVNLESLDLVWCKDVTDLGPLAELTRLRSLNLARCAQINDLRPLAGLTKLESLDLTECNLIRDLGPLSELKAMRSLKLFGCTRVADLRPLSEMTEMRSLILSGCVEIRDLEPLSKMRDLQSLDLSWCSQLRDLRPLTKLTQLRRLDLRQTSLASQVDHLPCFNQVSILT